jgi:hypothetical protein
VAKKANEQFNENRKKQCKYSSYDESIPFGQTLPSRQWEPGEGFNPPIQKMDF